MNWKRVLVVSGLLYKAKGPLFWAVILIAIIIFPPIFQVTLKVFEPVPSINYLYFYSTAAQTLGGLIAILAVFMIFRLQTINANMEKMHYSIFEKIKKIADVDLEYAQAVETAEELVSEESIVKVDTIIDIKYSLGKYKNLHSMRKLLIKRFIAPSINVGMLILVSNYAILWIPQSELVQNHYFSIFSATFFLVLIITIVRIVMFVSHSLKQDNL